MGILCIVDCDIKDPTGVDESIVSREVTQYALKIGCSVRSASAAYQYAMTATDTFTAMRIGKERARSLLAREIANRTPPAAA